MLALNSSMEKYVVLICGLNIRALNRISLIEQKRLLAGLAPDLTVVYVGDKGSYLVTTTHPREVATGLILDVLRGRCPQLSGVAVAEPSTVKSALANLAKVAASKYGAQFTVADFGVSIGGDSWRAGLALPMLPAAVPTALIPLYERKNAVAGVGARGCDGSEA